MGLTASERRARMIFMLDLVRVLLVTPISVEFFQIPI